VVIASVLFAIGGAVIDAVLPDLVPQSVRSAEVDATPAEFTLPLLIAGTGAILTIVLGIAALVGLLCFRRWGRVVALTVTVLASITYPFLGFVVSSGLALVAYELSSMSWGAVLAMAYFSPLSARFDHDG
jgi:hypothetical protein